MEAKGLRINKKKTKIMESGGYTGSVRSSGSWPCSVCKKWVGANSTFCIFCEYWAHKR